MNPEYSKLPSRAVRGTVTCLLVLCATVAHAADCDKPVSVLQLEAQIHDGEQAYSRLDLAAFESAADAAGLSLPCVGGRVSPELVARFHRLKGVVAWLAEDRDLAARSFAASRHADPGLRMDLVPEGHELRLVFGQYTAAVEGLVELDPPERGTLYLDGTAVTLRAPDRPMVVQWLAAPDDVEFTRWLPSESPMPAYPISDVLGPTARERSRTRRRRAGLSLLVGGGLFAGAAGLLHGAASASRTSFWAEHDDWERQDLSRVQRRTNRLSTASIALGGVALGLGTTGLVLRR